MRQEQKGFTLVEIAIVLVIIGLLLGGILKGQELINSARVRNLADSTSGIQAAYFGFIDRYRRVPGDWAQAAAAAAIGGSVSSGGNDNGRLDGTPTFREPNALWEHLSKAGFINGSYNGGDLEPTTANGAAPFNPFNSAIIMNRSADYTHDVTGTTPPTRLNLVVGRGTPVDIARELDTKLDDSDPATGGLRSALSSGGALGGTSDWSGSEATCTVPANSTTGIGTNAVWDVNTDSQDCNPIFLF
jgi:prepilin-type N-terminal cleavage/methylation domain-containing protein